MSPPLPVQEIRSSYLFEHGQHTLCMEVISPKLEDLHELLQAQVELALVVHKEYLVLLCKFGTKPWRMSPFHWNQLTKEQRAVKPNLWVPATIEVVIRDGVTGQEYGHRSLLLGAEFTASLCGTILIQDSHRFHEVSNDKETWNELKTNYPTAETLLPFATARTLILP